MMAGEYETGQRINDSLPLAYDEVNNKHLHHRYNKP